MKRALAIMLALSSVLQLTGCNKSEVEEPVVSENSGDDEGEVVPRTYPLKWFDGYHSGNIFEAKDTRGFMLTDYPDLILRCNSEELKAEYGGIPTVLFTGMPIMSVYLFDFTGDDKLEICATVRTGSGIISDEIVVYDYATKKKYELSDRGTYDYALCGGVGEVLVEKRIFGSDRVIETGKLVLEGDELRFESR